MKLIILLNMKLIILLIGTASLILGLYFCFDSNRKQIKLMGDKIRKGGTGKLVEEESILEEKTKILDISDKRFKIGQILTLIGIVFNFIGTILP